MEEVGETAADMKLVEPEREAEALIPSNHSLMVACPPGCVRGKVYFDTNTVANWMRSRRVFPSIEKLKARLVCGICGERPAEIRVISRLTKTKLATLPGMAPDGRSMLGDKKG